MKLPSNDRSLVPTTKITEYLLNLDHEQGKSKARFFYSFGFTVNDIDNFKEALIQHSILRDVQKEIANDFGKKYELRCDINTPDLRNPCIVTVWIIEKGSEIPKLVTAYPFKE